MRQIRRIRQVFLAIPIILLFFWLAIDSMAGDSPTMDEQNHIARGLAFLVSGDPRFSLEHPPLINVISSLPILTLPDINLPFDDLSWQQREGWYAFAEKLLWAGNQHVDQLVFIARLPIVFLTIGLGLIGYRFSKELWGKFSGLVALVFLLFDPNILAHGRYSTTDVGGTATVLLAAYLLWRLWIPTDWHWGRLLIAGFGLGIAIGSKFSNLVFVPIFAILTLLPLYGQRWKWTRAAKRLIQYSLVCVISILTVWTIYAFEYGSYRFLSPAFAGFNRLSGPMPTYLAGIEQIFQISGGGRPAFLLGNFSAEGWWFYFPVALMVKTPLLVLLLFLTAAILLLWHERTRLKAAFLVIPPVLYFLASMQSDLNIGYRHLLPILPFFYVLSSGMVVLLEFRKRAAKAGVYVARIALVAALVSVIAWDMFLHPHYLSYFNLLVGGPANGHKVLVDSNIDWGQDLLRLRSWIEENEIEKIKLSWFGTADPAYYGINYDPLPGLTRHFDLWWDLPFDPENPEPGLYAISVSNLWELPLEDKNVFAWFRAREPDYRIGYSIHIYLVGDNESS